MKNKLTNFGVYIVKNLFPSIYDKIWSNGAKIVHDSMFDEDDYPPQEDDYYESDDVDDFDPDYMCHDYVGYGGEDTRADFLEWRAQKPHYEGEEFINEWIGDVSLAVPSRLTSGTWEIYSRNILFEDCERYNDKVSALLRIYWLQNVWTKEVKA